MVVICVTRTHHSTIVSSGGSRQIYTHNSDTTGFGTVAHVGNGIIRHHVPQPLSRGQCLVAYGARVRIAIPRTHSHHEHMDQAASYRPYGNCTVQGNHRCRSPIRHGSHRCRSQPQSERRPRQGSEHIRNRTKAATCMGTSDHFFFKSLFAHAWCLCIKLDIAGTFVHCGRFALSLFKPPH